jgi:hypothetical protein
MIEQLIHITVVKHLEARAIKGLYWFHPANGGYRTKPEGKVFNGLASNRVRLI